MLVIVSHRLIRGLVGALVLFALSAALVHGQEAARRPNIVFILLDDVRWDDLYGYPFVQHPHMERLAAEGASFDQFFTVAPLCSPSRASFLTGQYAHRHGIIDNAERNEASHQLITFPRLLHDAGYRTAFIGKWHMGHQDDSRRPGFDHWVSFKGQGTYHDPELNVDGVRSEHRGYATDILNRYAVEFVQGAASGSQPFLVYISHKAVHPETWPGMVRTFPAAPRHEGLYGTPELPRSPNYRYPRDEKPALDRRIEHNDPRTPDTGTPDEDILGRLRMLASVDDGIGAIRQALEQRGELDRTLFIVTSDQGFFYGEFGLAQERRLAYEESIRIPFIARYPRLIAPGSRPSAMALNIDVAPTLLELGGAPVPEAMDGRSLVPVLAGDLVRGWRDAFLIEYWSDTVFPKIPDMGYRAVRTQRYKYIRYDRLEGMDELYDLLEDPYELNNLLHPQPAPGAPLERLRSQLEELLRPAAD